MTAGTGNGSQKIVIHCSYRSHYVIGSKRPVNRHDARAGISDYREWLGLDQVRSVRNLRVVPISSRQLRHTILSVDSPPIAAIDRGDWRSAPEHATRHRRGLRTNF
jgi:hypothetical protein